jgi:hypothetical protein
MYLYQNMHSVYGDIGDLADSLDTFSLNDYVQVKTSYSYSTMQQTEDLKQLCALTSCLSVTECNVHLDKPKNLY